MGLGYLGSLHTGGTLADCLDLKQDVSQDGLKHSALGGVLASHLKPKQCGPRVFWGVLHLCHLGVKAGAVVRTNRCVLVCTTL